MSAKGKFSNLMSTRNLLILALIFSIIIAGYVLITTYSGESEEVLTVKEVLEKKDELTDSSREIKVKGYFIGRGDGENISIADSQKLPNIPESPDILTVDYSGVESAPEFSSNRKYTFTGVLKEDALNPEAVVLIANEIKT